jgi:hypothetical protein
VRSEFARQKSQNSISTGRPSCWSRRSIATLTHSAPVGKNGALMMSGGARTSDEASVVSQKFARI